MGASILHRSGAPENRQSAIDRIAIKENHNIKYPLKFLFDLIRFSFFVTPVWSKEVLQYDTDGRW